MPVRVFSIAWFCDPVFVDAINIYETYNAGGVVDVEVLSPEGSWLSVWQADHPMVITTSRMFSVPIEKAPPFRVSALKLHVDCTASGTWVEIDAVELVGRIVDTAPPPDVTQLQEDLARLVNDKDTSDISFNIEGQTFYAHRGILSVRSQYFSLLCKDSTRKMTNNFEFIPTENV
ncbi:hypothetical protein C0Q70_19973 [Pomacea canaliculata]|uniref:BTB domain-containing protein n=1 Tax=Pomacea canaliculata TaxID=400727 RepID=A0A2T7NE84_POMCA|nr:hypothetical protein C0Q70_19973 [Pomacea canaliculata]